MSSVRRAYSYARQAWREAAGPSAAGPAAVPVRHPTVRAACPVRRTALGAELAAGSCRFMRAPAASCRSLRVRTGRLGTGPAPGGPPPPLPPRRS